MSIFALMKKLFVLAIITMSLAGLSSVTYAGGGCGGGGEDSKDSGSKTEESSQA